MLRPCQCSLAGDWLLALAVRTRMAAVGVAPTVHTYNALIAAAERGQAWDVGLQLYTAMQDAVRSRARTESGARAESGVVPSGAQQVSPATSAAPVELLGPHSAEDTGVPGARNAAANLLRRHQTTAG